MNELEMRSYLEANFDDLEDLVLSLGGLMNKKPESMGIHLVDSWMEPEGYMVFSCFVFFYEYILYKIRVYEEEYWLIDHEISDLKIEIVKRREKVVYEYYAV